MEPERLSPSDHMTEILDICVVKKYVDHSVRRRGAGRMPALEHYGCEILHLAPTLHLCMLKLLETLA
jgi:hypothetical protein